MKSALVTTKCMRRQEISASLYYMRLTTFFHEEHKKQYYLFEAELFATLSKGKLPYIKAGDDSDSCYIKKNHLTLLLERDFSNKMWNIIPIEVNFVKAERYFGNNTEQVDTLKNFSCLPRTFCANCFLIYFLTTVEERCNITTFLIFLMMFVLLLEMLTLSSWRMVSLKNSAVT